MVIKEVRIPDYITHIVLSKSRRAKYFKESDCIPKKYAHLKNFDNRGRLLGEDGTPVIKNPRTAGTPRLQKINGQVLYSTQNPHIRAKMMEQMKAYFKEHVQKLSPAESFPICVEFIFRSSEETEMPDIDNHSWVYAKAILDAMTDEGIIPDDSPEYVNCQVFHYDPSADARELVIRITSEE